MWISQPTTGDHQQHHDGELVHLQREIRAERPGGHPGEVDFRPGNLIGGELREFADRFERRQETRA